MAELRNTSLLIRLAWRNERIKLILWTAGIVLLVAGMVATVEDLFANSQELEQAAIFFAQNPIIRLFTLPAEASVGGFVMLRAYIIFAVLAALMSMLATTRLVRRDEEIGRAELISSGAVGRQSGLAAALILVALLNVMVASLAALVLIANDLDVAGSWAAGASIGAVGLVFAGISAVAGQLTQTARGANGISGAILGGAYLASAVGSMLGDVEPGEVMVEPAWSTWLSPIGWGQMMRPFAENNWWVLMLFLALFAVLAAVAFMISVGRDVGHGMLPARRGPDSAPATLSSPAGLSWRLQRGALLSWTVGVGLFAAVFGAIFDHFEELISEIEGAEALFGEIGGAATISDSYMSAIAAIIGILALFYVAQTLLRMRAEEAEGRTSAILATSVSRLRWKMSYQLMVIAGAVWLLIVAGVSAGLAAFITTGDWESYSQPLFEGMILQLPAVLVMAGLVSMLIGIAPRRVTPISWALLMVIIACSPVVSDLLDVPEWAQDISPLTFTAAAIIDSNPDQLLALSALGLVLAGIGWTVYRIRDIGNN